MSSHANPLEDEALKSFVQETMDHYHVPGLSMAIVHDDDTFSAGFGSAQLAPEKHVPATPETLWYAASTSKSFTTAALAVLMDDRKDGPDKFDWKTRVTALIGGDDFVLQDAYATAHATLEDLATHRTGMGRHDLSCRGATPKDLVRNMRHLPYPGEFREGYRYNNLMYITLGYITECLSGTSLPEFWRTRIWEPLGMHTTTVMTEEAQSMEQKHSGAFFARGYHWDEAAAKYVTVPFKDMSATRGAGGIISSALDYAKWLRMMLEQATPLSKDAHKQLRTPRIITTPTHADTPLEGPSTYALGWVLEIYRGTEVYSHGGGLLGYTSFMCFVPSRRWGVVLFSNTHFTAGAAQENIFYRLLDDVLETPAAERFDWRKHHDDQAEQMPTHLNASVQTQYPSLPDPPQPLTLPLAAYAGTYTHIGYGSLKFDIADKLSSTVPRRSKKAGSAEAEAPETGVLVADGNDCAYIHYIELEHVSGEFWTAWLSGFEVAENARFVMLSMAVEFKIGSDGKVTQLGIAWEGSMEGEKIWYTRQAD